MKRKTKIICTLGPAVDSENALRGLLEAGMNVARLNFSHGTHEEHARRIANVKRACEQTGIPCALMLDTKGPEIRTGQLAKGEPLSLRAGQVLTFTSDKADNGTAGRVYQTCPDLAGCLSLGSRLLLDDGRIELVVTRLADGAVECEVQNEGVLGERKSINIPGAQLPLPAVTDQDRADLLFGIRQGVDVVAASFVRDGAGVREIKTFLAENGGEDIAVIAKIEAAGALDHIREIVQEADGIMVARGDLGVEVPAYRVPYLQKSIIRLCNRESKPVITATQMLDSMIRNPRPTRAEVADVANAIYDGTDCIMLSGETASGKYPLEAARAMAQIACEIEPHIFDESAPDRMRERARTSLAVGIAAVQTAETILASCIIAPTMSGRTARLISKLRPRVPIYAVTPNQRVMRQLLLSWGVTPLLDDMQGENQVMGNALAKVRNTGYVKLGDLAVITTGDAATAPEEDVRPGVPGIAPTNEMQVVQVR